MWRVPMKHESIRWPTWDELKNEKGEVRVRILEPKSQLKSKPYLAPKFSFLGRMRSGMDAVTTIAELRKQQPNILEITVPEPGQIHIMMLHRDEDLEQAMRDQAPAGLMFTFTTFDTLIENGERLMRHFRGD